MKRLVLGAIMVLVGVGSARSQPPPPTYAPIPAPRIEVVPRFPGHLAR